MEEIVITEVTLVWNVGLNDYIGIHFISKVASTAGVIVDVVVVLVGQVEEVAHLDRDVKVIGDARKTLVET